MQKVGHKLSEWTLANGKTILKIYSTKEELIVNKRIKTFLSTRKKGENIAWADYMDTFELKPSKGTMQNDLLLMVKIGLTEKIGNGLSIKYKIR